MSEFYLVINILLTRARALGYQPKVDVKQGVDEFVKWYNEFYQGK